MAGHSRHEQDAATVGGAASFRRLVLGAAAAESEQHPHQHQHPDEHQQAGQAQAGVPPATVTTQSAKHLTHLHHPSLLAATGTAKHLYTHLQHPGLLAATGTCTKTFIQSQGTVR